VCSECHGLKLEGSPGAGHGAPPDLRIVAAYAAPDFERLMRTGVAVGGRRLGLMGDVARSRFSHLTDAEVRALYTYLRARAAEPRRPAERIALAK
jgi:mono/diheme cytochrome c family protein